MTVDRASCFRVSHRTTYHYAQPMSDGYTIAHLLPRPTPRQHVEWADVDVVPEPDARSERVDVFGNRVLQLGVHHAHDALTVHARSEVVVGPEPPLGPGEPWEVVALRIRELRGGLALAVRPFAGCSPYVPVDALREPLRALAEDAFEPHRPVVDGARALCHLIHERFDYDPASTDVSTPLSAVLRGRRGVCQDFAHLATGCLRALGLAARYVSGYLETGPPGGGAAGPQVAPPAGPQAAPAADPHAVPGAPAVVGADASHAWCSLWVPQHGWVDLDPTNDRLPTERHVTVAWGRDYGDVAPVRGVVIGPPVAQTLDVEVHVERC